MPLFAFIVIIFVSIGTTFSDAEELNIQAMRMSINKMEDNLRTPFAKTGLEMTVWNFYRARTALSRTNYEGTRSFKEGFKQCFAVFQKRLRAGNFQEISSKIRDKNLRVMAESYQRNKYKYLYFMKSALETPYFPPRYSLDLVTKAQFYYSLILFDAAKDQWAKARKFTYIFPFCDD